MATTAPPWKAWSLDDRFLADLDEWTKKHPEDNKLDIVLDKICEAIRDAKPWIDLIPNSPFPAGSLIQGLAAVVQLGHSVRKAKSDALRFAKDTVEWIGRILLAFQQGNAGQSTQKTWENLDSVRYGNQLL
ncbi:hypothetical protein B0H14DRAFT_3503063 [Mycena olivaceomarginata]|nr:hypothetical protein B0H14DRAFT_3503063 [Mycena olivaceomarginata]